MLLRGRERTDEVGQREAIGAELTHDDLAAILSDCKGPRRWTLGRLWGHASSRVRCGDSAPAGSSDRSAAQGFLDGTPPPYG